VETNQVWRQALHRSLMFRVHPYCSEHLSHSNESYIRELDQACTRRIRHNSVPVLSGGGYSSLRHNHQNKPSARHTHHPYGDVRQTTIRGIACYICRGLGTRLAFELQRRRRFGTSPPLGCCRICLAVVCSWGFCRILWGVGNVGIRKPLVQHYNLHKETTVWMTQVLNINMHAQAQVSAILFSVDKNVTEIMSMLWWQER